MLSRRRLFFEFAYRLGRPRWDTGITPPELVELVEGPQPLNPGRALDLGCGTGTNAVYLARHGWEATGVDYIGAAVRRARRRAGRAGVRARFVAGDATRLGEIGVMGPFDLVTDIGCFHGVPAARRDAYARGVTDATRPGATLLLFGFGHGQGVGLPGAPEEEVRRVFAAGFEMVEVLNGWESSPEERRLPTWYRLVRRQATVA